VITIPNFLVTFGELCAGKIKTKLLFSTACHSQTNEQIEVVNKTLSTFLRALITKKNLKTWKKCLQHVESIYNRVVHSTT